MAAPKDCADKEVMEQSSRFQSGAWASMATAPALSEAAICLLNLDRDLEAMIAGVAARPHIRGVLWPCAEQAALVIVDLDQEGGAEAVRQVRDGDATVPILILTADLDAACSLATVGKVDFLSKPLIPEILGARLAILIRPEKRNHVPVASVVSDEQGRILSINRHAEELFGSAPEDIWELIPSWEPGEADGHRKARDKEGIEFPARVISTPKEDGGRLTYATLVFDQRAAEPGSDPDPEETCARYFRDLQRKRERLKQFANAIGHDFQEPLRMVVSYTQLVEQRYGAQLGDHAQPLMEFAVQGAMRINALLQALCDCMEAESAEYAVGEVDCGEVLDSALEELKDAIRASRAVITRGELPRVMGDGARLGAVLRHLIDNGIKFNSSANPTVRVWAEQEPAHWTLSVEDNGIGIEPGQMERAFTIFKRLHGTKYPGAGIGLTVCSTIVERHGGRFWAESTPGKGSTFRFTIPRKD